MSMSTPNSSGNMQNDGYLGCFYAASARENISGVCVINGSVWNAHWSGGWWVLSLSEHLVYYVPSIVSSWNFQDLLQLSSMWHRRGAPFFSMSSNPSNFKVTWDKKLPILNRIGLGISGLFEFTDGCQMMHKAWSSIEEVPYCFPRSSIKFQGRMGQKIH